VTELEPGVRAEAIKNISVADSILTGHFPGRMLYPGVLLVECVAQLAAIIYGTGALAAAGQDVVGDVADRVGYLAEIKQTKFLKTVTPGDQVVVRAQSGPRLGRLISVTGQASVGRDVVMTTRLVVTDRDAEETRGANR
jgi:3-hydroxyacyl-[acyl-carrier-protein] dehydratase